MRVEITPLYEVTLGEPNTAKRLVSIRKRLYREDGDGDVLHAEWFLDWATGEWCPTLEAERMIEINAEMRIRVGWVEERDE